jgi:hypothetical protein
VSAPCARKIYKMCTSVIIKSSLVLSPVLYPILVIRGEPVMISWSQSKLTKAQHQSKIASELLLSWSENCFSLEKPGAGQSPRPKVFRVFELEQLARLQLCK